MLIPDFRNLMHGDIIRYDYDKDITLSLILKVIWCNFTIPIQHKEKQVNVIVLYTTDSSFVIGDILVITEKNSARLTYIDRSTIAD